MELDGSIPAIVCAKADVTKARKRERMERPCSSVGKAGRKERKGDWMRG